MTQLTYTIAHARVGAENYWEEVEGFISSDLEALLLLNKQDCCSEVNFFSTSLALESMEYENLKHEIENFIKYASIGVAEVMEKSIQRIFKRIETNRSMIAKALKTNLLFRLNTSHPLSPLAKELGAMIFGGSEEEKDFYVVMPTKSSFRVNWDYTIKKRFKVGDLFRYSRPEQRIGKDIPNTAYINCENGELGVDECAACWSFWEYFHMWDYYNNIFQEYARTGVLENELYKQFFNL